MDTFVADNTAIRALVRKDLPAEAFTNHPLRTLWIIPLTASVVLLSWVLLKFTVPWYAALPLALLLGHQYGCMFFFGHELSHDAMIRSRRLQDAILYICYWIYFMPPCFTRVWHFTGHHAYTQVSGHDPDIFGTVDEFWRYPRTKYLWRFSPGSRHWLSVLFFFTFAAQVQVLLWYRSATPEFRALPKIRARLESFAMMATWIAAGVAIGMPRSIFVIIIPMLIASAMVLVYGATNHALRPLTGAPDALAGSMSVTTWKLFDRLHFHFSHHIEHHMFPSMGSCYAPLVRRILERHAGDRYLSPPHWKALVAVFLTPHAYESSDIFADPWSNRRISVQQVESALRSPGLTALKTL